MRFSLALISSAMIATIAFAAPATRSENTDMKFNVDAPAESIALEFGQDFQPFHFSVKDDAKVVDRTFNLHLSEPAELQITDYMLGGDSFEVVDNGVTIGSTIIGAETRDGESIKAEKPEDALQDSRFSHGSFMLPAGHHEISLKVAASPYSDGTGAIRVVRQLNAFYAGGHDDDDDDDKDDDKDWEDKDDDENYGKDEGKWGNKGTKTVYIYHTVEPTTVPIQTTTLPIRSGVSTAVITDLATSATSVETTDYFFYSLPIP